MRFSRQEYWNGLPFPSPEDLPNPEIGLWSPELQAFSSLFELPIQRKFVFSYHFVVTESSSILLISLSGIRPTALGKLLGQHCAHFRMGQTKTWKERVLVEVTEKVKGEVGMGVSGQMLCFAPSSLTGGPLMTNPPPWLAWGIGGICPLERPGSGEGPHYV